MPDQPYTPAELNAAVRAYKATPPPRRWQGDELIAARAGAVLSAVIPLIAARVRAQVAQEIPGWAHGYTVIRTDSGSLDLSCDWCGHPPCRALKPGIDLEELHIAARDHDRICRARAPATTTGEDQYHDDH